MNKPFCIIADFQPDSARRKNLPRLVVYGLRYFRCNDAKILIAIILYNVFIRGSLIKRPAGLGMIIGADIQRFCGLALFFGVDRFRLFGVLLCFDFRLLQFLLAVEELFVVGIRVLFELFAKVFQLA